MEYNNYYPVQSGHHPPNQQHEGNQQMQQQPPQSGGQMMHSPIPHQNIRQTMQPGPPNHQQMQQMQSQQQQHIGHHPQQLNPQHQQHPNYQQIQPLHPHGPPVSHSSSPHAQQQHQQQPPQQQHHHHQPQHHQHHNHSHQSNMPGPLPQPQGMSHIHSQSPHHHQPQQHHGGPMQMQQQQPLNQMVRPQVGPAVMNHPQSGIQQSIPHQQNFFSGGPMPQQPGIHYYTPNPHHPNQQSQHHQPPAMHHVPPLSAQHLHMNQNVNRNSSPYYPNILQTEFRIIELNRRLQCRPIPRHPYNPLPGAYDESVWWERFASDFFEDDATLTLTMHDDKPVEYTIGRTLIPRFFRSYFTGGVTDLSFNLRNPKETFIHPHMITLDCDQAFIVTNNIFRHPSMAAHQGVVVHTEGHFVLDFVNNSFDNLSIKSWRFYTRGCREYIDRSIISSLGLPTNYLAEPMTKHGFTKSTITYLKMCMIMEPMQELMFQNRQTKLDPRSCLRKLLFDRYKFRSGEENRAATNKRRKRKPSAAPALTSNATTNKKSKAGLNNAIGNNAGMNNMMSPSSVAPNFSLASQDVMVVGEPSMMGGDFGDDNERMITRLENTQYDPTASNLSMVDESANTNAPGGETTDANEDIESSLEHHVMTPGMIHLQQGLSPVSQQQQQQQQQPQQRHHNHQQQHPQQLQLQQQQLQSHPHLPQTQPHQMQTQQQQTQHPHLHQDNASSEQVAGLGCSPQEQQAEFISSQNNSDHKIEQQDSVQAQNDMELDAKAAQEELVDKGQTMFEHVHDDDGSQHLGQEQKQSTENTQSLSQNGDVSHSQIETQQMVGEEVSQCSEEDLMGNEDKSDQVTEETMMNSISDVSIDASIVNNVGSVEPLGNHPNSNIHEEPNSNPQLQCSTPNNKSTIEQQQPVDNGVA